MNRLSVLECTLECVQQKLACDHDLTTRQIRAFFWIAKGSREGDPFTTEDIRRLLNMSSQFAHKTVSYFVDHGFIERRISTFDSREKHLHLTDAGRQIADFMDNNIETARLVSAA